MKEKVIIDVGAISWNDIKTEYLPNTKSLIMGIRAKEVITCKDCKYWAEFTFAQPPKNYCGRLIQADYNNHNFGFEMDADDFCSRGERK